MILPIFHSYLFLTTLSTVPLIMAMSPTSSTPLLKIKLYLIRHSETISNSQNLVLGQTDSPLTDKGHKQGQATGMALSNVKFHKMYTSDLRRARITANYIIERNASYDEEGKRLIDASSVDLFQDVRLREKAKGVREGRLKTLSIEDALDVFRAEQRASAVALSTPLLETDDQVWDRFVDWTNDLVDGIMLDLPDYPRRGTINGSCSGLSRHTAHGDNEADVVNIMAVSHSGTIRIILNRLFGADGVGKIVEREDVWQHTSTRIGEKMDVPNTSITIIEVTPKICNAVTGNDTWGARDSMNWIAKLSKLTCIDHLQGLDLD